MTEQKRGNFGYFFRESALIVVSILAALGVNEWRMRAAAAADEREALAAVYAELGDNLEILGSLPGYHGEIARALYAEIAKASADGAGGRTPIEIFTGLPNLRPAILIERMPQDVAWELAKQRGAAARFDYDTARRLSVIYESQRSGVTPLYGEIATLIVRPEMYEAGNYAATLSPLAAQIAELSSREASLVRGLEDAIKTLADEHPKLAGEAK